MSSPPKRLRRGRILSVAGTLLKVAVVVGVVLHLSVRDAVPGVAVVYYALPRVVLAGLGIGIVLCDLLQRRKPDASLWGAVAVGIVAWSLMSDWRFHSASEAAPGIRVMYWNACRGYGGWGALIDTIREHNPDFVALGETEQHSGEFREMWRREMPEYDVSFLGAGMMCLVRGTSSQSQARYIDGYSHARELDVTLDGNTYRCLIVDVYAHPLYNRRTALTAIATMAEDSPDLPLLILGDFNTPTESVHFADLRRRHANAFEQAGCGCIATWPSVAPVLSLDQIWVNSHVRIEGVRHPWTSVSDHCPVLMTAVKTSASPASRITGN